MKKVYSLLMAVIITASLFAQPCNKLYFSEYLKGDSTNKALEIYNATSAPINLFGYKILVYSNGSITPSTTFYLNGTISAGDVYVIVNSGAKSSIKALADTLTGNGVVNFTGNDALALLYITDTIDVFGRIGNNPGNAWNVGSDTGATANHTLIRKSTVQQAANPWDTTQWLVFPKDTIRLGAHSGPTGLSACLVAAQDTIVEFSPVSGTFTGVNGNYSLSLMLSLPHTDSLTVDVQLASGNAAWVNNYTTQTVGFGSGVMQRNLSLTITNDTTGGVNRTLTFKLVNFKGLVVGADSVFTLTLQPPAFVAADTCATLFISEYVEGSSFNKVIEIYNPTPAAVNLTGYRLLLFPNGATAGINNLNLTGSLAAGGVYVVANTQASAAILAIADDTSNVANYNGDDAVALLYGIDTLDVIGVVGTDPGTSWTVSTGSTVDYTLVRKAAVKKGTKNWTVGATQWDVLPKDTLRLDSHTGPLNETACTLVYVSGVNETVNNISRIYPNPNNGNFTIEVANLNNTAEVRLFDLAGRMVYYTKETSARMNISTTGLNAGMYIVEVKTGDLSSRTKITIQ